MISSQLLIDNNFINFSFVFFALPFTYYISYPYHLFCMDLVNNCTSICMPSSLEIRSTTPTKEKRKRTKKVQAKSMNPYKQHSKFLFTSLISEDRELGDMDFGHLVKPSVQSGAMNIDPQSAFNSLKSENEQSNLGDVQSAFSSLKPVLAGNSGKKISEGLPGPPLDLKAVIIKARFVILSWKPPQENSQLVEAYSTYFRQEGSSRWVFEASIESICWIVFATFRERCQNTSRSKLEEIHIGDLWPGKVYHFRVVPLSANGAGVSSDVLTVTTQAEEHVPSAPQNFIAYATSPRKIHINWKPPEISNGKISKYTIYYMEVVAFFF